MLDDVESSLKMTVVLNINVKVVVVVEVEAIFYHQWLRCLVVFCLHDVGCTLVVVKERICATLSIFSRR